MALVQKAPTVPHTVPKSTRSYGLNSVMVALRPGDEIGLSDDLLIESVTHMVHPHKVDTNPDTRNLWLVFFPFGDDATVRRAIDNRP